MKIFCGSKSAYFLLFSFAAAVAAAPGVVEVESRWLGVA